MNLHTSVDYMKFNPDGQILAMSSRREKDSLKLLHVPTQTVFSNWPTTKTPLSYVWSMDFSPASKYMAIGNDKGKCLLYKLSHYHDDM
jgi:U3 small nucleolar RNA-associated protein 18